MREKSMRGAVRAAVATGAVAALTLTATSSTAQDERAERDAPGEVRSCINLNEIDHTTVVDDDTILFYGRGHDVYRNDLPNHCPELRNQRPFMYRVALSRLCSSDTITVLDDIGFGFTPGATCGLGKFAPITEDEAADLESRAHDRGGESRRERNREKDRDRDGDQD